MVKYLIVVCILMIVSLILCWILGVDRIFLIA